ncbi:ABC-type transport auxiliary lipoprotein family protein [Pelagibius sp. 7325]|uniref:ABC-type transport auxiliary lipoprotein family protein n=1 Tax=Pelagibius sp. 7325 TaxID=3131994 RepID=UPI0030EDAB22
MKRLLPMLLLAPLLVACLGSAPPVPRDHYYRLLVPMPAEVSGAALLPGVMTVEPLLADGLLRERPLLYSAGVAATELQQHNYHYWNDVPPRMLQDQMVTYLRRSGAAGLVVTPDTRVRADYRVSGKAKRFERLVGDGAPKVVVEIELVLQRLSDDALLVVDTYSAEEAAENDSVGASIDALNRATAGVLDAFLGDLRQAAIGDTAPAPR